MYQHFFDTRIEGQVIRFLEQSRGCLDWVDVRTYFARKRPLLPQASPEAWEYIRFRYRQQDTLAQPVQIGIEMACEL